MKRRWLSLAGSGVAVLLSGCALDGTWRTVKADPEGSMDRAPFKMVTFADGNYTSTGTRGGATETNTGTYTWDGSKLTITPAGEGAEERSYSGYVNVFTGQLVLCHEMDDQTITAYLEKDKEE